MLYVSSPLDDDAAADAAAVVVVVAWISWSSEMQLRPKTLYWWAAAVPA